MCSSDLFQGFRENFNMVIGLSNLSKESRDMFFSEFKEQIQPDRERGMHKSESESHVHGVFEPPRRR